ncbi:MAG: AEC family transporter [Chloroflexota bacterium]
MTELLLLFLNNLLPIFIIAGIGYTVGRLMNIPPRNFSVITYYVFNPCLVISIFIKNQLQSGDVLRMMAYALAVFTACALVAWLLGKFLRLERRLLAAVVLTSMLMNTGNLGIPVNLFAFGETAMALASIYFVTNFVFANTAGVMVASLGAASPRTALVNLLKVPTTYAMILAMIVVQMGWKLPLPIERAVDLLGNAAVPSMLVLLGLQLQNARWTGQNLALGLVTSTRLLIAPLIAVALVPLFGLQGVARQTGILESAMPTAVVSTVLSSEYDVEPAFVSTAIFVTTLLSPLTLTPLLYLLGA